MHKVCVNKKGNLAVILGGEVAREKRKEKISGNQEKHGEKTTGLWGGRKRDTPMPLKRTSKPDWGT